MIKHPTLFSGQYRYHRDNPERVILVKRAASKDAGWKVTNAEGNRTDHHSEEWIETQTRPYWLQLHEQLEYTTRAVVEVLDVYKLVGSHVKVRLMLTDWFEKQEITRYARDLRKLAPATARQVWQRETPL